MQVDDGSVAQEIGLDIAIILATLGDPLCVPLQRGKVVLGLECLVALELNRFD